MLHSVVTFLQRACSLDTSYSTKIFRHLSTHRNGNYPYLGRTSQVKDAAAAAAAAQDATIRFSDEKKYQCAWENEAIDNIYMLS